MKWLFVLKDKSTHNQGWWLKISTAEELEAYYKQTMGAREENILSEYLEKAEDPNARYSNITQAVIMNAQAKRLNIIEGIRDFRLMVAAQQLESIHKNGAIYINRVGGYHGAYEGEPKYDFVHRENLIFPDFKKEDIRIKKFEGGQHYYAYIDDMQVRDGDTLKWNTYDEAYRQAEKLICD